MRVSRLARWLGIGLVAVVGIVVLATTAAILVLTKTPWGHVEARRLVLGALRGSVHGIVRIGTIEGDLLDGVVVTDLAITDSAGAPFLSVERASLHYRLADLLHQRLAFTDVRMDRPVIVLTESQDSVWNYRRIFPPSPGPAKSGGFGSYITMHGVQISGADLTVHSPWHPDTTLHGAARDSAIAVALSPESRADVRRVPGGFEKTLAVHDLNTRASDIRLADPAQPVKLVRLTSLSAVVAAFRPPAAAITDVVGAFYLNADSLWWPQASIQLPASQLSGRGRYTLASGDLSLALRADTVALSDARFLDPRLPASGGLAAAIGVEWHGRRQEYRLHDLALHTGGARASGQLGIVLDTPMSFDSTDLRFAGVDTRLIEQVAPSMHFPRRGRVGGHASLAGPMSALAVRADVSYDDSAAGTSRVTVQGEVGLGPAFQARHLTVTVAPLQLAIAIPPGRPLPVSGTITGHATLDGSTQDVMTAQADLVHRDGQGLTHLVATGDVAFAPATGPAAPDRPRSVAVATAPAASGSRDERRPAAPPAPPQPERLHISADLQPLDLAMVGRFVPSAHLHGSATGRISASGTRDDLHINARFGVVGQPDSAGLTVDGDLHLRDTIPGYDVTLTTRGLDARALSTAALPTAVTATFRTQGRGVHPETMTASLAADAEASTIDSVAVDTVHVRASIADGQLHVDTAHVHLLSATADVHGSLGMTTGHSGTLEYRIAVDSLHAFQQFMPHDTTVVEQRAAALAAAIARARADSARLADSTEVERTIRGQPANRLVIDTPQAIRRDALSGRLVVTGTAGGDVRHLEVAGDLTADSVIAIGDEARRVRVRYRWAGAPDLGAPLDATVHLESVVLGGFTFDTIAARLTYRRPDGTVHLLVDQDSLHSYTFGATVHYTPTEKSIRYDTLALRFDTTYWRAPRPASIDWGPRGLTIHQVELDNGRTGRIFVDGVLGTHPDSLAHLRVGVRRFDLGDLGALAQFAVPLSGDLSLNADLVGSLREPRLSGSASISSATARSVPLPNVFTRFAYDTMALVTHLEMAPKGAPAAAFAVMDAAVPINLGSNVTGSRLLDRPLSGQLRIDSLPLDVLPQFESSVRGLGGRVSARVTLAGTSRSPVPRGSVAIDGGKGTVVSTGTSLDALTARVHLTRDSVVIDSLVARTPSTGGTVNLSGSVDRADTTVTVANLTVAARNLRVLNTRERGQLDVDAALTAAGPVQAPYLYGSTTVRQGVFYIAPSSGKRVVSLAQPSVFVVVDTTRPTVREVLPTQESMLSRLLMDVEVRINRDTWVRNESGNVEAHTDGPLTVHTDHAHHTLVVNGTISTDVGEYAFMGKRFAITKGVATFIGAPDLNPSLVANGEYDVPVPGREALAINVNITGNIDSLRLALSSNAQPPIPQTDLLSYLAFSAPTNGLTQQSQSSSLTGTTSSGGVVGTASTFVENQLAAQAVGVVADQLKGNLARALDADVLSITTGNNYTDIAQNKNNAAATFFENTQLEFGKYFNPQTFVSLQASVAPGARVVRRVGPGVSVQVSGQPLYLLGQPTLTTNANTPLTGVLGLSLVKSWRF